MLSALNCVVSSSVVIVFFFKQKTAYEMRISDWSSDVCSSDLAVIGAPWPDRGQMKRGDLTVAPSWFHRCSEGSESEADACDERVEVTEIVDELVTIFALGIDVLGQLVLVAGTDVRIVDVAKGR